MAPYYTEEDGVLDLTPHVQDPCEHIKSLYVHFLKGFCGHDFDLGERPTPFVPIEKLAQPPESNSPKVCSVSCVECRCTDSPPCMPAEDETTASTEPETMTTPPSTVSRLTTRSLLPPRPRKSILKKPSEKRRQPKAVVASKHRRVVDTLCVTAVAIVATLSILSHCGHAPTVSIDQKSSNEAPAFHLSKPRRVQAAVVGDDEITTQTSREDVSPDTNSAFSGGGTPTAETLSDAFNGPKDEAGGGSIFLL